MDGLANRSVGRSNGLLFVGAFKHLLVVRFRSVALILFCLQKLFLNFRPQIRIFYYVFATVTVL